MANIDIKFATSPRPLIVASASSYYPLTIRSKAAWQGEVALSVRNSAR